MYNLMKLELEKIVEIVGPEIDNTTKASDGTTTNEEQNTINGVDDNKTEGELGRMIKFPNVEECRILSYDFCNKNRRIAWHYMETCYTVNIDFLERRNLC